MKYASKVKVSEEFYPSVTNPYSFLSKPLFKGIHRNASLLGGKLLDFGCGSKPYKSLFSVDEYIGVDFENEGHSHEGEDIDVFYNGKELPFTKEYFDSVLCSEVFEHVFNLPEVLIELNRVLKTGGKILITCPFVWKEHEVPHDYARYTLFALESLLAKAGFKLIVREKGGNFVEVLFQLTTLFFHDTLFGKISRLPVIKQLGGFFLFVIPNAVGALLSRILPQKNQLYLSNVVVAEKVSSVK